MARASGEPSLIEQIRKTIAKVQSDKTVDAREQKQQDKSSVRQGGSESTEHSIRTAEYPDCATSTSPLERP
jgi:hypothetical protein